MCLGLSLRTGGGDLITGGDSAGEVLASHFLLEIVIARDH